MIACCDSLRIRSVPIPPRFVDLFAGCGGLSLGLVAAGMRPILAVEKSAMAAETYFHNFISRLPADSDEYDAFLSADVRRQANTGLVVGTVSDAIAAGVFERLGGDVHVVVGGPPCQGFSLAGQRDPNDPRNSLAWDFLKVVELIRPKAVLMENVPGMRSSFGGTPADQSTFRQLSDALGQTEPGYYVAAPQLRADDFGVPQGRVRQFLLAVRRDLGSRATCAIPAPHRTARVTAGEALMDLNDNNYVAPVWDLPYASASGAFAKEMRAGHRLAPPTASGAPPPDEPPNHQLRVHSDRVALRFRLYHALALHGLSPESINWGEAIPVNLTYPLRTPDGSVIAETPTQLASVASRLRSKKHSQRVLAPGSPSPTVMTIPDDFIHPTRPRTLTVREMARLQSFPDLFEFRGKVTTGGASRRVDVPQYTQVGNAVPPLLGMAIGVSLSKVLT